MQEKIYDALIVGTGPAGMFAALELIKLKPELKILMSEKGSKRDFIRDRANRTSGFGGAGAFSDGKLTLSSKVGGQLLDILGEEKFNELMNYVDSRYVEFGGNNPVEFPQNSKKIKVLKERALKAGLETVVYPVRHFGTDKAFNIIESIWNYLKEKKVEILVNCPVESVQRNQGKLSVILNNGEEILAQNIILAPGREGEDWLLGQARALNLKVVPGIVDLGVRVEKRAEFLKHLTDSDYLGLHDLKFIYYTKSDNKVRTFCTCPYGFVTTETYGNVVTVNGESYTNKKSENTNFAILVSSEFTEPFKDATGYGKYIARLANLLAGEGKVIVQRLGDLKDGKRSYPEGLAKNIVKPTLQETTPGNLGRVLPATILNSILEMLKKLEVVIPKINDKDTLIYGVEVKFYSSQVGINKNFQTLISGLYIGGDGSGRTRGLLQSSMTGVIIARDIIEKGVKNGGD